MISRLHSRVPPPPLENLCSSIVTTVTLPLSRGVLGDDPLLGSTIWRHTYRHKEKPVSIRFST
jgi:hypothetical protein